MGRSAKEIRMQKYRDFIVLEHEESPKDGSAYTIIPHMIVKGDPIRVFVPDDGTFVADHLNAAVTNLSDDYWMNTHPNSIKYGFEFQKNKVK